MNKLVTVIVTCYNHENYIGECLESIFKQSYRNIELIVINDGSTDKSGIIIEQKLQNAAFKRVEYISHENRGSCIARNEGLDSAKGEFILMVDSDNYLDKDHIKKSLELLETTGKDIAYPSLRDAETGEVVNEVPEFSLGRLITANYIDTCSLIRSSVIGEKRFDEYLNRQFMQDYDFFLSLVHNGAIPIKIKDLYLNYRNVKNSVGNAGKERFSRIKWIEVYNYINNKYPEYGNNATNLLGTWYLELNNDFEKIELEIDKLYENIERNEKQIESYKLMIRGKEEHIERLEQTQKELLNSSIWKYGKIVTYPFRKIKDFINIFQKIVRLFKFRNISEFRHKINKAVAIYKSSGYKGVKQVLKAKKNQTIFNENMYQNWITSTEKPLRYQEANNVEVFDYSPMISILIPVFNVDRVWLEKCIDSIKNQWYTNWEICIADDASTKKETIDFLNELKTETRIKVVLRKDNGHISAATNSALQEAEGEFIALVDNDDELSENALYEVVKILNKNKDLNMIYSDEDKIGENGQRFSPHFKPDWSPDLIMNQNYVSHLGVYKTSIAKKIGGFREGYEGAQDHDFILRFVEMIDKSTIFHIPKILYHWRTIEGSTASKANEKNYAYNNGIKTIEDALKRRKTPGKVTSGMLPGIYDIEYKILKDSKVSIIIPTKNGYEDLKQCVNSILEKTTYTNYEIIIANNGSDDSEVLELFLEYQNLLKTKFKVVDIDIPFNYSRINNIAAKEASGDYLLFLNNDTSIISNNWIETMLGFAQYDRIGCVGAKLWYFDDTIQHAGVILGLGGVAGHSFVNSDKNDPGYYGRLYVNYNYTAVTAACLMVSKNNFEAVGGFDEQLEVAFNDIDLCIRVYQLGRDNVWAHNAELYHYESKSRGYEDTPEKERRFKREIKMMKSKHGVFLLNDPAYNENFSLDVLPFTRIGR